MSSTEENGRMQCGLTTLISSHIFPGDFPVKRSLKSITFNRFFSRGLPNTKRILCSDRLILVSRGSGNNLNDDASLLSRLLHASVNLTNGIFKSAMALGTFGILGPRFRRPNSVNGGRNRFFSSED